MAVIPFPVLCKCRNVLKKKQRRLRSPAQLIKESNTFDSFDFLSSSSGASIIQNISVSVGRWKKIQNQIITKSKNFDHFDFSIIRDI